MPPVAHARLACALALVAAVLAACSNRPVPPSPDDAPQYLAIGDSYTAGYQPGVDGAPARNTTSGFAWKVASERGLRLVNISCSGITAVAFVEGATCPEELRGPDGPPPADGSQADTMTRHLARYGDHVELVTVVLGANDLRRCTLDETLRACAQETMPATTQAVDELLTQIREHVGDDVPILGLTYPDFWTGEPVLHPEAETAPTIADTTVDMFRTVFNPALRAVYERHGATFVDVTEAFGAYAPAGETVESPDFGTIPARAAKVCALTFYCTLGDLHPTREGHDEIARLVQEALDS